MINIFLQNHFMFIQSRSHTVQEGKAKMVNTILHNQFSLFTFLLKVIDITLPYDIHMQYFSKNFSIKHIVKNVQLPKKYKSSPETGK